jgi:hypothetical protein
MTTIEHIKQLAHGLSREERTELARYFEAGGASGEPKRPMRLRDSWKVELPEDFDLDKALHEIRTEWLAELDEL